MPDYGVRPEGLAIKRLDTIVNEMHDDLSAGWNVNTRLNPKSFLNVLVTAFADKIAELWEFGQEAYFAMYPSSAEGMSLDFAAQFGGSTREAAAKTYYPIHCECVDGTVIPVGSVVASTSNPIVSFTAAASTAVDRSAFNKVKVRVLTLQPQTSYTVALDGALYSYVSGTNDTVEEILQGLKAAIIGDDFIMEVKDRLLVIEAANIQSSHALILTENLTTETVTAIVTFASEYFGEVVLPDGAITRIVTAVPGFKSCVNLCGHIAGRLRETDVQFRQSYAKKIFGMSTRMVESVTSAILLYVQGVKSVTGYENDTHEWDSEGRPPHSIEMVVDGGSDFEIARQILATKAAGIVPHGSVEVEVPGTEGELITVRFNRPTPVYAWLRVAVTMSKSESLPANYVELIKESIVGQMDAVETGRNVIPQKLIAEIYRRVTGIDYLDITAFYTGDPAATPDAYEARIIPATVRQRVVADETRIEVVLVG